MWFNCSECNEEFDVKGEFIIEEIIKAQDNPVCDHCNGFYDYVDSEGNFIP